MEPNAVVVELEPFHIELSDLALTTRQADRNLTGSRFGVLHLQLDELTADLRAWSGQLADRIVAIGEPAAPRPGAVATRAPLPPLPSGFMEDDQAVAVVVERLGEIVGATLPRVDRLGGDPVSQDLLIDITAGLEQHRWMFSAQRV
jgi:starvation-inducible DNA-binding protein